jgi:predicted nucleic-acid-binding protein
LIGLDTNVLVRYIVQDDAEQARRAAIFIENEMPKTLPGLISLAVMMELTWVLSRAYGYAKRDIANVLEQLLVTDGFEVETSDIAWAALRAFREGSADFSDYCICIRNRQAGAAHTVTFDRRAAEHEYFVLLK